MRRAGILAALAVAACASCQLVYGLDDFHPAGTTSSGSAAGGGGATCGESASVACVPASRGFTGYFHLVESAPGAGPDRCVSGKKPRVFHESPAAACAPCSCDGPPSPACSRPDIDGFAMSNCPTGGGAQLDDGSGDCTATFGAHVAGPAPKPLACAASGGGRVANDWKRDITLCEISSTSDGCADGEACVPIGEPVCVIQEGASGDCPAGWSDPRRVFAHADDTLGCGACVCTPNFTCPGRYLAYQGDTNACFDSGVDIPPNMCTAADWVAFADRPPSGHLTCAASGGKATGAFTPTGPSTICCKSP